MKVLLVESFVRCNSNRNSTASVFEYYTSRLRSYWEKCKENIDIMSKFDRSEIDRFNLNARNLQQIIRNMEEYEKEFFRMLDVIIKEFYKTYNIEIEEILSLIVLVREINCLSFPTSSKIHYRVKSYNNVIKKYEGDANFFFIFNDSGYFYLNTYLYALFNGVIIIGIPSSYETEFDERTDCPIQFISHDFTAHSLQMINEIETGYSKDERFVEIKERYSTCINDSNYTTAEKENISFLVWMCFHEFFDPYLLLDEDNFLGYIIDTFEKGDTDKNNFYGFTKPIFQELYDEDMFQFIEEDKMEIINSDITLKAFMFCLLNGYFLFRP